MSKRSAVATAPQLADLLSRTEPRLGRSRLIAIDGRSGCGKTWLAGRLACHLDAPVIHMDDLYAGWDGLASAITPMQAWIITPLARQFPARWRRFDWDAMAYAEWHETRAAEFIVLEGCGSIRPELAEAYAARIWLRAPAGIRQSRIRAREDWAMYQPHAGRWAAGEDLFYREQRTLQHCDIVVDNPGRPADGEPLLRLRLRAGRVPGPNASQRLDGLA